MEAIIYTSNFQELSFTELMNIDGGAWSWKEFAKATGAGAFTGAVAGATGGTMALPGVGTVAGAAGMGAAGAVVGAATYALFGWW